MSGIKHTYSLHNGGNFVRNIFNGAAFGVVCAIQARAAYSYTTEVTGTLAMSGRVI